MRVKIKYTLKNEEEKITKRVKGMLIEDAIKFHDDAFFELNLKEKYLKRYTDNYEFYLSFGNNEVHYLDKDLNRKIKLHAVINSLEIKDNSFKIIYKLESNEFNFQLSYEVIK